MWRYVSLHRKGIKGIKMSKIQKTKRSLPKELEIEQTQNL